MVRIFKAAYLSKEREWNGLNWKKRMACVVAAAVLMLSAGCAKQSAAPRTADVNAVADEIAKTVKFKDQMSPIAQKTAVNLYGLDAGDVAKARVYESTGATAEEVAAFEAKDDAAAAKAEQATQQRVEDQKAAFQDYQPKEMSKLKAPLIVRSGKYVVLVVADDTSAAKTVTDKYFS